MAESNETFSMGTRGLRIRIVGVGGAGTNVVDRIQLEEHGCAEVVTINTDAESLESSPAPEKVLLGRELTRGLGAGGDAELGQRVARQDREKLREVVVGADLVFVVAGLGGGTGSGASPLLCSLAAEEGATVIAFGTMPFSFEGKRRHEQAERAMEDLRAAAHAALPLPNDVLMQQLSEDASVMEAFALADAWIVRGIRAILSMISQTGLINVDFATLRRAFAHPGGKTLFGLGEGTSADAALNDLVVCPLLHLPEYSKSADTLVVNIAGGTGLTMGQVNMIMAEINERFKSREDSILGAVIEENLGEKIQICVIGTKDVRGPDRGTAAARTEAQSVEDMAEPRVVHASKLAKRKSRKGGQPDGDQSEFGFTEENEQRGAFDESERNIYDGEDLDVPTFIRKNIKVALH